MVVQQIKVSSDYKVVHQFSFIGCCTFWKLQQILVFAGKSNFFHRFNVTILELEWNSRINQLESVLAESVHNFGEQHEFKCVASVLKLVHGSVPFESFIEVWISCFVVFFVCWDQTRHVVNLRLQMGHDVNRVANCFYCCQSCFCLWKIL